MLSHRPQASVNSVNDLVLRIGPQKFIVQPYLLMCSCIQADRVMLKHNGFKIIDVQFIESYSNHSGPEYKLRGKLAKRSNNQDKKGIKFTVFSLQSPPDKTQMYRYRANPFTHSLIHSFTHSSIPHRHTPLVLLVGIMQRIIVNPVGLISGVPAEIAGV